MSVFGFEKVHDKPYNSSSLWRQAAGSKWWKRFRDGEKKLSACSTILLKLAANGMQHVFEEWVERLRSASLAKGGAS
jgi:hypothetical protein